MTKNKTIVLTPFITNYKYELGYSSDTYRLFLEKLGSYVSIDMPSSLNRNNLVAKLSFYQIEKIGDFTVILSNDQNIVFKRDIIEYSIQQDSSYDESTNKYVYSMSFLADSYSSFDKFNRMYLISQSRRGVVVYIDLFEAYVILVKRKMRDKLYIDSESGRHMVGESLHGYGHTPLVIESIDHEKKLIKCFEYSRS